MANNTLFMPAPQLAATHLMGLGDDERFVALDLAEIMRGAFASPAPRAFLMEAAQANAWRGRGWSFRRLEARYYALRNGADPADVLINKAKIHGCGKSQWITPAVAEDWRTRCARHFRSYKSAYMELVADYRAGRAIGDVDWRAVWAKHPDLGLDPLPAKCPRDMPLPEGWSLRNFLRAKPKKIEEVAARIGRMAAHALARPVRTTRAEMAPGMQYVFDDLTHDNDVVVSGQLQPVRPMELACVDVASAYKAAFWLMPSRVDALTQKRQVLRERHMRFLVAHVLCNVGFHPDGVTLLVENGTAAIRRDLEEILHGLALRDDGTPLIEVSRSGVDRATAHPGQWGSAAKGNFRAKSHLESWNNLSHNRLDDLPGQTGSNARLNAPEDLPAMERVSERLLLAGMALPPELASRLQMPVLDWRLFTDVLTERYAQIHNTHDHALEGWERRTERQWRLSLTDSWHSEAAWRELSDEQQRIYAPVIAQAGNTRVARLSRFQVWRAGMDRLVRLPDYATALICGRDLAEVRPCPATMSVRFIDQETSATPMDYRLQSCVAQDGRPVTLIEGRMYRWMISPFDPSKAFVLQLDGSYVGRIERVEAADRTDMDAVHRAMGKARADFDAALAPLARRGAAIAKQQIEALRANTAVLQAGNPRAALGKPTAAERAEESAIDAALDGLAAGN